MRNFVEDAIGFCVMAALALTLCVLVSSLAGCGMNLEHDITIGIDLADDCLLRFPECAEGGGFECVSSDGTPDTSCEVACVAARTITCDPEGPSCTQLVGDTEQHVPVVCIDRSRL